MCDRENHDFVVAGLQKGYLVALCRWCGEEKTYFVGEDFKIGTAKIPIAERE